jgi:hypothetical protein
MGLALPLLFLGTLFAAGCASFGAAIYLSAKMRRRES